MLFAQEAKPASAALQRPHAKSRNWVIRCLTIIRAPVAPDAVAQPYPPNTEQVWSSWNTQLWANVFVD